MTPDAILLLPLWYAVFLLSVTAHEAAHALVALRGGDETAYAGGQVTLNPIPHIQREPFGTILVPLMTYYLAGWMMGWASAPYDPEWERRYPRRAAAMAAAGPAANLILAILAFAVLKWGLIAGLWVPASPEAYGFDQLVSPAAGTGALDGLGRFCSLALVLNVLLFVFNLIPVPPLDGAAIVSGLIPAAGRLQDQLRASGMGAMIGLVVALVVFRRLFHPLFGLVERLLYG